MVQATATDGSPEALTDRSLTASRLLMARPGADAS